MAGAHKKTSLPLPLSFNLSAPSSYPPAAPILLLLPPAKLTLHRLHRLALLITVLREPLLYRRFDLRHFLQLNRNGADVAH